MSDSRVVVTELLMNSDQEVPADALLPVVYDELRRIAEIRMAGERSGHTLQATDLVHEAFLKLVDQRKVSWSGQTHFLAVASTAMRRLLIDHARGKSREKRGGGVSPVTLHEDLRPTGHEVLDPETVIVLEEALKELAELDARQAKVVELRAFGGLKMGEIAQYLGVSRRTVEGDWSHALAWLRRKLNDQESRE